MYKCPQCSTENVQKASIIYDNGTSDISLTMAGGGFSTAGGIISDGGYASGTSQSKLAAKMSPPKEKSMLLILFLLFWPRFFLWVGFTAAQSKDSIICQVIHYGFIALVVFLYLRKRKYNKEVYPKLLQEYDKTYFCHRCGYTFLSN